MQTQVAHKTLLAFLTLAPLVVLPACGGDDDKTTAAAPAPDAGAPNGQTPGTPAPAAKSIYAMHYSVVGEGDNRVSYIYLSDTLDVPAKIPLAGSRELYGYANSRGAAGKLLVSGEKGVIERFDISDTLEWKSAGTPISFANFEVDDAGFWRQYFQSDTVAYLALDESGDRIVWNPTDFTITGRKTSTLVPPTRDGGWTVGFQVNRSPSPEKWSGPVIRPYTYSREESMDVYRSSDDSLMVTYDPATLEEKSAVSVPCGELQVPSQDEQGNTYYSSWGLQAGLALYGQGPRPCVVRFKPDGSYDPTFTSDFKELVGGRPIGTFRYVRDGKALVTVLHTEEVSADFTKPFDETVDEGLQKHWRLWMIDLTAKTAKQVSGVQGDGHIAQAFMYASFGERVFILPIPFGESNGEGANYELDLAGSLSLRFTTPGFTYNWFKVR